MSLSLPLFWFVCAVVSALRLVSKHSKEPLDSPFLLNTFDEAIIYLCFSSFLFVLSNIPDKPPLKKKSSNCYEISSSASDDSCDESKYSLTPNSCPLSTSPLISRLTFFWMFRILVIGVKGKIQLSNLNHVCGYLKSRLAIKQFEECLQKDKTKRKSEEVETVKFFTLVWKCINRSYLVGALFELLSILASYGSPFMIAKILDFLESPDEPMWHGVLFVLIFVAVAILERNFETHQFYFMWLSGVKTKSLIMSSVHKKVSNTFLQINF